MYVVRFSCAVSPVNRRRPSATFNARFEAAGRSSLKSRLLVPITQAPGAPSLQFEVELKSLDQLEAFRSQDIGSKGATAKWMQAFSKILLSPPAVEILRVEAS